MSHVTTIDLEIKDLGALKAACERLGYQWKEGHTNYRWYGRFMGDYPMPEGMKVEDLGKCDHAISVPGASYEIGVVTRNGKTTLLWDFFYSGGLEKVVGKGGGKLKQAYATEATRRAARKAGFSCYETVDETGKIQLTMRRG